MTTTNEPVEPVAPESPEPIEPIQLSSDVNKAPKYDPSSIYPTPTQPTAGTSNQPFTNTQTQSTSSHKPAPGLRIAITLLGLYVIFSTPLSVAVSILTSGLGFTYSLPYVLMAMLMNPTTLILLLIQIVVGIGILYRKNIARITFIAVISLSIVISLVNIVNTINAANTVQTNQRQVERPSIQDGASAAQETDQNASTQRSQLFLPSSPTSQRYITLQVLSLIINLVVLVLITRPSVKKQFS